jgi:hypothetical protein
MPFNPDPKNINYKEVMRILSGIKEHSISELSTLEAKEGFPSPKDKETFCYWAGKQEAINEALFYVWDTGQQISYEEIKAIPTIEKTLTNLKEAMTDAGILS